MSVSQINQTNTANNWASIAAWLCGLLTLLINTKPGERRPNTNTQTIMKMTTVKKYKGGEDYPNFYQMEDQNGREFILSVWIPLKDGTRAEAVFFKRTDNTGQVSYGGDWFNIFQPIKPLNYLSSKQLSQLETLFKLIEEDKAAGWLTELKGVN
jgi:hypothetical protein